MHAFSANSRQYLQTAFNNLFDRWQEILRVSGSHFENLLQQVASYIRPVQQTL
jgi:hypothetical protein